MRGKLGRRLAVLLIAVSSVAMGAAVISPAGANTYSYLFNYNVDATTHLKTLDQTIVIKGGSFSGGIDLTGSGVEAPLRGSIKLPDAHFTYRAAGILPLINATARIVPIKAVTGVLNLATVVVTATATFNIRIVNAYATGTTTNLVGDGCITATPLSVTMSGPAAFGGPSTFSGTFTMPPLKNCGLGTTALNLVMPGPGNTFSAVATPKT
ncbi:MAG: hypothetical protein QOG50_3204 [Actinomycetota bacterium]|nr:hypothetical protein [Actinomycetota bacterium]